MNYFKKNYMNIFLILNIIYVLLSSVLHVTNIMSMKAISMWFIPLGLLNIMVALIYRYNNKIKIRTIDIVLLFVLSYGVISALFAYNKDVALYGFTYRYEGLFSLTYYLTLFHLCSFKITNKEYIMYLLITFGVISSGLGVLQKLGAAGDLNLLKKGVFYAAGFTNNSNFLSTLLLICISYACGLFVKEKDILVKVLFGISIYIISIGMYATDTLSGIVGLIVCLIILLINSIKHKKILSFSIIVGIMLVSFILMSSFKLTKLNSKIMTSMNESASIASGKIEDQYGTKRAFVWKAAIKEVPKHWATGIGIDNVYYIYDGYPIMHKGKTAYDKVHNEYLQILITEGVFALIAYLVFYFLVLKKGIQNVKKNEKIYLLLPVIGYLVQAFFNISVIEVAPLFYVSMGLLYSKE